MSGWTIPMTSEDCRTLSPTSSGSSGSTAIIAISKLRVQPGAIPQLLDDLADPEGPIGSTFKGASVIFGKWDVLVQLGGEDFTTVANAVFEDLPRFDAILHSDTLFT